MRQIADWNIMEGRSFTDTSDVTEIPIGMNGFPVYSSPYTYITRRCAQSAHPLNLNSNRFIHTCEPALCQTTILQTVQEVFSSSSRLWLSDARQRSASPSLTSCVPVPIYTQLWAALPALGCTNSHSHLLHSPPNPNGTLFQKQSWTALCHNYALDVSASFTGSTVCLYRKCTWGRRPSALWTGSTSTAHTSPEWRPSTPAEWASTARRWSCRPLRVCTASSLPPTTTAYMTVYLWEKCTFKQNSIIYCSDLKGFSQCLEWSFQFPSFRRAKTQVCQLKRHISKSRTEPCCFCKFRFLEIKHTAYSTLKCSRSEWE